MSDKKRRKSYAAMLNPFSYFGSPGKRSNENNHEINRDRDDEKLKQVCIGTASPSTKLQNNTQVQFLSAHSDIVRCLCKLDKDRFASSSDDGLILIWSTHNGLLLDVLCGHTASILSLIIINHNSFTYLISASLDHSIRVWDITHSTKQTKCIFTSTDHDASIHQIIKTKTVGLITASNNGTIGVWTINKSEVNHCDLFLLDRIINIATSQITKLLFLETDTVKHLVVGSKSGRIIVVNFDKKDRIKTISKHSSEIQFLYQSSCDRFISASYDGLICVWRIEPHSPQLLVRINDVQQNISSWSKLPPLDYYKRDGKKSKNSEIITEAKDLKLRCFVHFGDAYFIVSFSNSFVIFDAKFITRAIIKNAYDDRTEIVQMEMFGNDILITANSDNLVKFWDLSRINLKKKGVWLSCFRQELVYDLGNNPFVKKKKGKNLASDICVDVGDLLVNQFRFHSDEITAIEKFADHTFVSCDKANQIILWKDGYYVSHLYNQTIKQHFNLPSYN